MSKATLNMHIVEEAGADTQETVNAYIDNPDAIGGGGDAYELPAATTSTLGGVKMAAAVNDAADTVTPEDFNGLLAALREAGVLASS